jgi:hypothetical protein
MKAVTANRLTDGRVVYLTADRRWTADIAAAAALDGEAADAALEAGLRDVLTVVGPYLIDIEGGAPAGAKRVREAIRLTGPTTGSTKLNPKESA